MTCGLSGLGCGHGELPGRTDREDRAATVDLILRQLAARSASSKPSRLASRQGSLEAPSTSIVRCTRTRQRADALEILRRPNAEPG